MTDPLPYLLVAWDREGERCMVLYTASVESAQRALRECAAAEGASLTGPDYKRCVVRDAETRAWKAVA